MECPFQLFLVLVSVAEEILVCNRVVSRFFDCKKITSVVDELSSMSYKDVHNHIVSLSRCKKKNSVKERDGTFDLTLPYLW